MQTNHQVRPLEQGSAVSFVIVGLVLIGLLVGGIALIKDRADQVANTPPQTTTTQKSTDDKKPAEQSTPATESAPKTTEPAATTPAVPSTQTPPSTSSQTSAGVITATGPTETLVTTLILGFLTAIVTRYIQSRTQTIRQ